MGSLRWAAASAAVMGEADCGDVASVVEYAGGAVAAVIDAVGHGREAAKVAALAAHALRECCHLPFPSIVGELHTRLRATRGAAVSLAAFDWRTDEIEWLGVGNVAGIVVSACATEAVRCRRLLVRGGLVGANLPQLKPLRIPFARTDRLIMATDGMRDDFAENLPDLPDEERLAQWLLRRRRKENDDALVLVIQRELAADEPR